MHYKGSESPCVGLSGERGIESRKSGSSGLGAIYMGLRRRDGGSGFVFGILELGGGGKKTRCT